MSAAAFGDTMFRHGRGAGPRAIQKTVKTIAPEQYEELEIDGKMGPKTLAAFQQLSNDPGTRSKLLDELAKQRLEDFPEEPGRFNYFRLQQSAPSI